MTIEFQVKVDDPAEEDVLEYYDRYGLYHAPAGVYESDKFEGIFVILLPNGEVPIEVNGPGADLRAYAPLDWPEDTMFFPVDAKVNLSVVKIRTKEPGRSTTFSVRGREV